MVFINKMNNLFYYNKKLGDRRDGMIKIKNTSSNIKTSFYPDFWSVYQYEHSLLTLTSSHSLSLLFYV